MIVFAALHSLLTQTHYFLNADVAFLTQMALYGEPGDLYTQYYEINPPLIVYIYRVFLLPHYLADWSVVSALRISMISYLLIITMLSHCYLHRLQIKRPLLWLLAIALSLLFVLPSAFLQREHIIAAALIAYFLMIACRVNQQPVAVTIRLVTVVLAALAVCLKPQYSIVLIALELWYLSQHRSIKLIWRLENLIIIAVGVSYITFVYLFHPTYFDLVAPLASKTYIAYFEGAENMLTRTVLLILLLFLPYRYLKQRVPNVQFVNGLYVVTLAGIIAFLIGRAGFSYHLVLTFTLLGILVIASMLLSLVQAVARPNLRHSSQLLFFIVLLLFIRQFHFLDIDRTNYHAASKILLSDNDELPSQLIEFDQYKSVYDLLAPYAEKGQSVYMMGARLFPAHPVTLHLGLKWAGHFPVLWALPETLKAPEESVNQQRLLWLSDVIVDDIRSKRPKAILVESNQPLLRYPLGFNFVDHFNQYEAFQREFSNYTQISTATTPDGNWTLYLRQN